MERRLAAILAADVVGYSRLVREDEAGTLAALKAHREALIEPKVAERKGRIVKLMGDGLLVEFPSAVEAVQCAVEIQHMIGNLNADVPKENRVTYRIGINIGDIVVEDDDIYGDGVNVAARLEGLAETGGICVSRTVFNHVKGKLDIAFEHLGEKEVKNIVEPLSVYQVVLDEKAAALVTPLEQHLANPKRRWWPATAAVTVVLTLAAAGALWWEPWKPDVEPASVERMAFPLPEKPSIAVLPFDNLSGDSDQGYFSDGVTETLIAGLAQVPNLFVIARNSTFTYKGKPVKVQEVAEDLGVRYVLEGSVQKSAEKVRITAQLVDALSGRHIWAEQYDRPTGDIFVLQDDIARNVVTAMQVELTEGEQARIWHGQTNNAAAYELFLRGRQLESRFTRDDNTQAQRIFEQAVELDPGFAAAWIALAYTHHYGGRFGWSDDSTRSFELREQIARKALAIDDASPNAHELVATIALFNGQHDQAVAHCEQALNLNPDSDTSAGCASKLNYSGRPEQALRPIKNAMRQSPYYPAWYLFVLGNAHRLLRQYEEAVPALEAWRDRLPNSPHPYTMLAYTYAEMGRIEDARAAAKNLLERNPDFTIEQQAKQTPYKDARELERTLDGLRKAGVPEKPPLALPDKPSIAVLPFTNMSDDPDQEYFADGMSEDLITDLSKLSGLFVIARNSSFAYKGKAVGVKEVSRELGIRYVLEGSVRRMGDQVRINAQLIDATTGGHVWAERYDGVMTDVFALQDRVLRAIVDELRVALTDADNDKLDHRPKPVNVVAYDWLLKGRMKLAEQDQQNAAMAKTFFEKALEADPTYARAYTNLGLFYWNEWRLWGFSKKKNLAKAQEIGHKAVAHDTKSAAAATLLAVTYQYQGDHVEAEKWADNAMALEPTLPETLGNLGTYLRHANRYREATEVLSKAIRLDPLHPPHWLSWLGHAYFMDDKPDEAISVLKDAVVREPNYIANHVYLAGIYAVVGDLESAAAESKEVLRLNSKFTVSAYVRHMTSITKDPDREKRLGAALLKAGLPE